MKRHLQLAVKNEMFSAGTLPPKANQRFYPRERTVRNHMVIAKNKLRRSMIDQEDLDAKVTEWKVDYPNASVFFRAKSEDKNEKLLFVYQDDWQKRLLVKYGNELAFLDATYRTTRYALPLFFLVVKTNVDYQVVGVFIIENETEESITEALGIIKKWNKDFKPTCFMTDYSNEEINSIKKVFGKFCERLHSVFPECKPYLFSFVLLFRKNLCECIT